jgi:hypothetical protein
MIANANGSSKKPVYRVTNVVAAAKGGVITINADGEVRTGGWEGGELLADHSTRAMLVYRFVATPPTGIVTQAITPIHASKTAKSRAKKVKVIAQTNEMVVDVR